MVEAFLRPVKGDFLPRHYFALAVSYSLTRAANGGRTSFPVQMEWGVLESREQPNGNRTVRWYTGIDKGGAWELIRHRCKSGGLAWVFVLDAGLTLPVSGFFDAIERKRILLSGTDPRAQGDGKDWQGFIVMEDPPTIVSARPADENGGVGPATYKVVDVRNYGVESWDDLDTDGPVNVGDDWTHIDTDVERLDVLSHQCEGIRRAVSSICAMLRENGLGGLQTTASAQAMYSYRRSFLKAPVFLHRNAQALSLERSAYYGGRCEAYYLGEVKERVYHLDVQSFYPSVCVASPMPSCPCQFRERVEKDELNIPAFERLVIAEVTLSTPAPAYPLRLPGRVVWPIGTFRTFLCGPELILALNSGHVRAVWSCATYEGSDMLSMYSRVLWEGRKRSQAKYGRPATLLLKRMLNGLSGKFGQIGRRWVNVEGAMPEAPYMTWYAPGAGDTLDRYRVVAWNVQREEVCGETGTSCPAIAAWVTSLARVQLWKSQVVAGRENVYYCDTDSLHVNATGYARLLDDGQIQDGALGKFRLVEVADSANYLGLKHYRIGDRLVCSGMVGPKMLTELDSYRIWTQERLSDNLTHKQRPLGRRSEDQVGDVRKYLHGRVGRDGRVEPLRMNRGG